MAKPSTKNTKPAADTRMLAALVPDETYDAFQRIAAANERTVAAELRVLVREHIAANGEQAGAVA